MTGIRATALKCATFATAGVVLLVLLYNTMVSQVPGNTSTFHARFTEVSGLRTGDDVRVAGVAVGEVQEIAIDGDQADVTFTVQKGIPVTVDTGLVLRYQNLIGQRYVALVPGSTAATALSAGSTIPVSRTSPGFDLTALLNGFRPLFQVLRPEDINALSESIIKVLQGEGGTVSELLQQTSRLTNYLADREQLFHQVAANLTPVLEQVSGNGSALQSSIRQLAALTSGLAANRRTFGSSLDGLAELVGKTDTMVEQLRTPLRRDIRDLAAVAALYADHGELWGGSFPEFGALLATLGRATSYRSAINTLVCRQSVNLEGSEVPVGTTKDENSEVCR